MTPVIAAVLALIGKLIPDPAQAAAAQAELLRLDAQGKLAHLNAAVQIIVAEASGNWLQKSWRPLLMLTFGGLIVARWMGFAAPNLSEAEYLKLWDIVQFGMGGYIVGKSVETVASTVAPAITAGIAKKTEVGGNGP